MRKKCEPIVLYVKDKHAVREALNYIYTVDVYEVNVGRYSLHDTKDITSKEFKGLRKFEVIDKQGKRYHKYVNLTAAPIEYITKNKYKRHD